MLADDPLLHAARADLLEQLGRAREAAEAFLRAAELTDNTRLRQRLVSRAERCRG